MKNPLFNRRHIQEYLLCGAIAAILYIVMVIAFLLNSSYENLYLLYVGNILFIAVFGLYTLRLTGRQYEGRRSVSMLIAGQLALIAGVVFSILLIVICIFIFHPALFSSVLPARLISGAPASVKITNPVELILMLVANVILVSGGGSSMLIVIFSYGAKRNQTLDAPVSLENHI